MSTEQFNIKKMFIEIKDILYDLGYENKKVTPDEIINLYNLYGKAKGISKKTFIFEILDVDYEVFIKNQNSNQSTIILKTKDILSNEQIEEITEQLITKGYCLKKINYSQFNELYNNYGVGLRRRTFAIKVLKLTYSSWKRLNDNKNNSNIKVVILKNLGNLEKIKNQLLIDGYSNYLIRSYDDFLTIYNKYGTTFTKNYFAEKVLEIKYDDYRTLQRKEKDVIILPAKEKIIENIITTLKEIGYTNKQINYIQFLDLYRKYGQGLEEKEFALEVCNLSLDNYKYIKYKNGNTPILKPKESNSKIETIQKILVLNGYVNKPIDYKELTKLYQKYGQGLEEKEFALEVLELTMDGYRALRRKENKDKMRILKNKILDYSLRIQKILIEQGYENKKIYYNELHFLYLEYGGYLSERQFAMLILNISSSAYQMLKYKNMNKQEAWTVVLPYKNNNNIDIYKIKKHLIEQGYENKQMSITEIDELYNQEGKGISKKQFLEQILEIYNYYDNKTFTVLRKQDILDETSILEIKKLFYQKGYYYKRINPEDIVRLYEDYGSGLTYKTFINIILGLNIRQVTDAKSKKNKVKIIDREIDYKMEIIKNKYLTEIRYYSKEEILSICEKYNIMIEQFIYYTLLNTVKHNHETYLENYLNILNNHNQLWIGKNRVSNEIIEKYYNQIEDLILKLIHFTKSIYSIAYKTNENINDDFQILMLFFLENGSEIEKNFMVYDNSDWERYLYGYLKRKLMYTIFNRLTITSKITDNTINTKDEPLNIFDRIEDKNSNTERQALENIAKNDNNIILLLGNLILEGYTILEAKKILVEEYNISEIDVLNNLKTFIEQHNLEYLDLFPEKEENYQKKLEF